MKSPRRNHQAKRSRWAHANTPEALRRRRAAVDAKRVEIAARIVDPYQEPAPGDRWQSVAVYDSVGAEMLRIDLYVPRGRARCDQHSAMIDGAAAPMMAATEIGRAVARAICSRPSRDAVADIRREEWAAAVGGAG